MSRARTVDEVQRSGSVRELAGALTLTGSVVLDVGGMPGWLGVLAGTVGAWLLLSGVSRTGEARGRRRGERARRELFAIGYRLGVIDQGTGRVERVKMWEA